MARGAPVKNGTSKVRLVVFEAEVSDGDLSQFAHAIQNALQSRQIPVRVLQPASKALADETSADVDQEDGSVVDETADEPVIQRAPRSAKPRAVKAPKVIDGVDWNTDPSLKSFAEQYSLKTDFDRYLVVALWFKEHRGVSSIGAGHVYTAFRHLGWSVSIPDFSKPLRNLRDQQLFTGGSKEGFAINQLGEGKVKAKRRAGV